MQGVRLQGLTQSEQLCLPQGIARSHGQKHGDESLFATLDG